MGKSGRDGRNTAPRQKQRNKPRTTAGHDDLLAPETLAAQLLRDSRKGSRAASLAASRVASLAASRVASRAASPATRDRHGAAGLDELALLGLVDAASHPCSRLHTPGQSDDDSDLGPDLESLEGEELIHRLSEILSSKTSARGARHKIKQASSKQSEKELALLRLCAFLRDQVFDSDADEAQVHSIHNSVLAVIKSPRSPIERNLALEAFMLVAVTSGANESVLSNIRLLKEIIGDEDESEGTKELAIRALTVLITFGDSDQIHRDGFLDYLVDIVHTDGYAVDSGDSAVVVGAAMEAWAFVAPGCDLHAHSIAAMEAFIEQLESTDGNVQVLAATNIALMFDISRKLKAGAEDRAGPGDEPDASEMLVLYDDPEKLAGKMAHLSRDLGGGRSRKDKTTRKEQVEYAVASLELDVGYGYSTVTKEDEGAQIYQGYCEVLKMDQQKMVIKSWGTWSKVRFLQRVMGGFAYHAEHNERVSSLLQDAQWIGLRDDWDREKQICHTSTRIYKFMEDSLPEAP